MKQTRGKISYGGVNGKDSSTVDGMDRSERAAYGPRIRAERTRMGMSQAELAEAAKTTMRTVGSVERGDTIASPDVLERLLHALGLSPIEAQAVDAEMETLIAVVRPFLATLDAEHRAHVMPKLIEALVREMRQQIADELRSDVSVSADGKRPARLDWSHEGTE